MKQMKYFITTDNGHIEDILGDRATFETIQEAISYVETRHKDWTDEVQSYEIGTDNGVVWNTIEVITL